MNLNMQISVEATMGTIEKMMCKKLGINPKVYALANEIDAKVVTQFSEIDKIREYNQMKVLHAMQKNRLSDVHFNWNTGYGYDDMGREVLEKIYSDVFNAEDAIVRPIIVNGTHALTLCLTGLLRPNDLIVSIAGKPYDTLDEVIGITKQSELSLSNYGVKYEQVDLKDDGAFDIEKIKEKVLPTTKMVYIQRSSGYSWRRALTINEIEEVIQVVKKINNDVIVMVDNCYGEFLDYKEPTDVGADIIAGSLIKNPGGGLAYSGGYIVGKKDLVELVSYRMTSPGVGKECGLMFGQTRNILQGLFIAPQSVSGALKGAIFCAKLFEELGYDVNPKSDDYRSDIIQAVKLGEAEKVIAFCKGVQAAAPVDSHVEPTPWAMPGYTSDVIMAAGAFIQGSSIELSADAPIREPYIVYFQGGLTYEHSKFGVIKALNEMVEKGHIEI